MVAYRDITAMVAKQPPKEDETSFHIHQQQSIHQRTDPCDLSGQWNVFEFGFAKSLRKIEFMSPKILTLIFLELSENSTRQVFHLF